MCRELRESVLVAWPMTNEQETTMASNEEIILNLYRVAEEEPKRFRSLFTANSTISTSTVTSSSLSCR